jgi:DUF971 family protein
MLRAIQETRLIEPISQTTNSLVKLNTATQNSRVFPVPWPIMPLPIDPRRKPTSVKVHVKNGAGVDIVWADGHASHYEFPYLREQCPCATCNDERGKKEDLATTQTTAFAPLPMFKPKTLAQSATPVGNYALGISFTDGHSTGIFSYEYLRAVCPCQECAKIFRAVSA